MKKTVLAFVAILFSASVINAQWVAQPSNIVVGHDIQFIDAVNQDICWGLAADPLNQQNPVQEFTRTVDGGQNWFSGTINNTPGRCPSSIFALNDDTAWVAMFSCTGGPGSGAIMRTNDGGATWIQQTTALFSAPGNFPNIIYFWDANNGMCMGDPVDGFFEIYTTNDGGTNWIRTPQVEIPAQQNGEFGITDVFTANHGNILWFGTNQGRIYKTMDRGHNWTVGQTPFLDYIGNVAFRDSLNGLCQSGGTTGSVDVARTTDGGTTWNLVGTNTAGMTLKAGLSYVPGTDSIYFISTPYAGSIDGTTFSPNDGTTWIPVDNLIHTDIEFVNDSIGWTGSNEQGAPMFKWSTPFAYNDVTSLTIDVPTSTGLFIQIPKATVYNNGLNVQTFDVTMTISGGYSSTRTISNLSYYTNQQIDFDPWTPASLGVYTITVYTSLGTDSNHNNDTLVAYTTAVPTMDNCGWVTKAPIALGTFGLAGAFYLDGTTSSSPGKLYSIGGAENGVMSAALREYSTVTDQWGSLPPMPSVKYQFSAEKVGNKIVCAGGYSSSLIFDENTYIYDIIAGTWSTMTPMPNPVGDYAAGVYKDSLIYYIGGTYWDGINFPAVDYNYVQVYDVANDTWSMATQKPGTEVGGLRGDINLDKIVVAGGFSQAFAGTIAEAYLGVIDAANPLNITWTTLPDYPSGPMSRLGAGTVFMDMRPMVLFVGGDPSGSGNETSAYTWAYDLSTNEWLIGYAKPTAVSNISNFVGMIVNDTLWMSCVGGFNGISNPNGFYGAQNEWLCLGPQVWTAVDNHLTSMKNLLLLYPNPSSTLLNVEYEHAITKLEVYNVLGEKVLSEEISNSGSSKTTLDISNLKPGVYSVKAIGENISNASFVKE
jgi:photosystem II stability/assembly factor-like uncharacterized protein